MPGRMDMNTMAAYVRPAAAMTGTSLRPESIRLRLEGEMAQLEMSNLRSACVFRRWSGSEAASLITWTLERRWNQVHGARQDLADVLGRSVAVDVERTSPLEHASGDTRVASRELVEVRF